MQDTRNCAERHIYDRLGIAVDFYVKDEDMHEVVEWICSTLPFDRLYYYGADRTLHVSHDQKREAFEMVALMRGAHVPRLFVQSKS